jgi:Amidohydrolase
MLLFLCAIGLFTLFGHRLNAQPPLVKTAEPVASLAPYIDNHAHPDPQNIEGSIQAVLRVMPKENLVKIIFMPPPFTMDDPAKYDAGIILAAVKNRSGTMAVLGGGGTLNPMIQQSVRSGDVGPAVQKQFKDRAEELLREGVAGFGEMTAEHFAGATPYQYAPPDHPLFLLLADIAAQHGATIDLHMEAVPQAMPLPAGIPSPPNPPRLHENIASFERLLAHNARAKIIWAHAGSDNTGYRTPDLCRRLLKAHPNLYMEIKIDPLDVGKNSPLIDGNSGGIKPDWLKLFQDFPDRFLIGSDQHYPEPKTGPQRWQAMTLLLNQLPADLRKKIATENSNRIYLAASGRR